MPSNINRTATVNPLTYIPNEDVVLAAAYLVNYNNSLLASNSSAIRSASCSIGYHVAIQQGNNELKLFVNGELIQTLPFAYTLHNILGSDLILELGGYHDPRTIGMYNNLDGSTLLGFATLGIRNLKISKYGVYTDTFTDFELYFRQVNAYPLKTAVNKPVPARGRIIDLITETNQFTSLDEVSWLVYTNIYLSNLDLTDFSLTQLGGIVDAELIDFSQVSPYVYRVTASTGTGNGTLTLNFIDNNTVRRSIDNSVIGVYLGELSLMGESYTIKKSNPLPVLYSGSNPYVKEDFFVYVQFDANVATFDTSKIGIQNAIITRSDIIDELTGLYRLTIRPTKEGAISIQALSGTGVTTNGLLSVPSEVFTRVYSESFVILQLPLDIANNRNDLSPARISLNQVTQGNESYSAEAPTGATSSLSIVPASETSGFTYNFNSVAGLSYLSDSGDWTIEWFSRTNTPLSSNFTHLFTLDNGNLGFSIYASNRRIYFARNYTQKASILTNFVWQEYEGNAFVPWSDTAFTPLHKYPHFAITKEGDVYRFYRNGTRINLIQSTTNVDIRQGTLNVGYYKNYVTDVPGLVSNIRLTYGKALYTSQFINVPQIPYAVPVNITDEAELVNNITAFSDNDVATLATIGNKIFVRFNTIAPVLLSELNLTINGEAAQVTTEGNGYIGSILVSPTSQQGFIDIVLTIDSSYAPLKIFTATTDGSNVFIDYETTDITITSNTPNTDDYIIDIEFIFNKPIDNFTAADVTVINGALVNLQATDYNTRYTGIFLATATGSISLSVDADTIQDRAGNLNNSSNVFTRTVVKPAYTPDPYYNNVVALIQDDVNIVESISNFAIDTNCALSNTTAPVGLNKSIYFDGVTSYLSFDTGYTIASSRMYTLELWCYVSNSAILRLAAPNIYNASEITSTSFKASWQKVENATSYSLDVAYDNNFNSKVPGYDAALVGDIDNITVSGDYDSVVPIVNYPRYLDSSSILFEWSYSPPINDTNLGYAVQCAIDPGFSNILYQFNNTSTNKPNMLIGDAVQLKRSIAPVDSGDAGSTLNLVDNSKGIILTGLYSTDSFPALMYFKGESSIRWYKDNNYQVPAIADDIEALSWKHVAIVNNGRYTYLYVDGHLEDKSTTTTLPGQVNLGYNIGHFEGYITGFRLTKDVARYTGDTYTVPTLPYSTN